MPSAKATDYGLAAFSLSIYLAFGYLLQRHETLLILTFYACLFFVYAYLVFFRSSELNLDFWVTAAFVFRISFLFSVPSLSDDIYRFIWDGRLLNAGISPYAFLPSDLVSVTGENGLSPTLFVLLNSQAYHSIYPPFAQVIFWFSTWAFPDSMVGSTVVIRGLIIAAEVGSVWVMMRLLKVWKLPSQRVLWYALNPLVILELTGNLHFEAFVVFFLLLAVYALLKSKWVTAGISMAMAVAAKLIPLMLLPLFLSRLGCRRSFIFYGITFIVVLLVFIPFYSSLGADGFLESLQLYFKKFEFNASVYYLVREYGFWDKGYNIIETTGWKLGVYSFGGIVLISLWPWAYKGKGDWALRKFSFPESLRDVPELGLGVFFIYLLFATTVHPWYIVVPIALSVFTYLRFPILWSFLIFLTYAGYSKAGFNENLWITAVEYILVIGYFIFEIMNRMKLKQVAT